MERRKTKKYLGITIISFFITVIVGLSIYQSNKIRSGPEIILEKPLQNATVDRSLVEITGKAKNISFISMNDNQIFTDEDGQFKEKILLAYGYNVITLKAQDRFGRTTEQKVELIYK